MDKDRAEFVLCWEDGTWTTEEFDVPDNMSRYDGELDPDDLRNWVMTGGLGLAYRKVVYAFPIEW